MIAKRNAKSVVTYSIEYWSPDAKAFLLKLHPQKDVADRVLVKLWKGLELLERFGPYLERPHGAKLHGYDGLYEIRAQDESGWYRLFYGFGKTSPQGVVSIALVSGTVKKESNPPIVEYERAEQRLKEWLESH